MGSKPTTNKPETNLKSVGNLQSNLKDDENSKKDKSISLLY